MIMRSSAIFVDTSLESIYHFGHINLAKLHKCPPLSTIILPAYMDQEHDEYDPRFCSARSLEE